MLQAELEERLNVQVTLDEYEEINKMYMSCSCDKDEFCKNFIENGSFKKLMWKRVERYEDLKETLKRVQEKLDEELEWSVSKYGTRVSGREWKSSCYSGFWSKSVDDEEEAKSLISSTLGFKKDSILIIPLTSECLSDRHGTVKLVAYHERKVTKNSNDLVYARFSVEGIDYEYSRYHGLVIYNKSVFEVSRGK